MSKKCIYCAIYQHNGGQCPIFKDMDVSKERGCPLYTDALDPCEICGNHIMEQKHVFAEAGGVHQTCARCGTAIGENKCQVCVSGVYCAFQQDTACTLPPIITTQHRQGNSVIQMQQKNPARIEQTCAKGCKCFVNEVCMREIGDCGKSEIDWNRFSK